MSRKRQRIRYELGNGDIRSLSDEEIKAILHAKILKGSKNKKVL